ncbi:RNA polymerase sigma factor [Pelagicoccus sp. SDUM812002]|uniref:RNA polymerase sigma factor n=1 Tax=Pelagicoccus sp. SDUM812002 TaxID=3041266 RepID=UPI00280FD35A|nr:RNA polymerase sigma factor [Pelagicoccus sp. SDUM812002]MDQ8188119.1 RNA polymerase sigma factor [Pelagicoccus sp. SDUM812002]
MDAFEAEQLMVAVRGGELDKLGTLFEQYHAHLIGFFRKSGYALPVSEDLAQETFWRVMKYRSSYDSQRSFRAWLFKIARNAMYDESRKSSRRGELIHSAMESGVVQLSVEGRQVSAAIEGEERKLLLQSALSRLPAEKRDLIVMCRFEELPQVEVAEVFGCSVGALKVRLFRALQDLKKEFVEIGGEAAL